ncbi:MAG: hypothetical protein L3J24_14480 [Xanthomonadales bacterium]|nr:hypothetical protein [Xanthomonadales bacterium]
MNWRHWENLNTLFNYPDDIGRAIYTAIESLNSVNDGIGVGLWFVIASN